MSVSVEQPLHFSQQPSSPPFSSPPQSPTHLLHAQPPSSPPPLPPLQADVEMSSSIATLAPVGQRHDREDADMDDGTGLTNGHVEPPTQPTSDPEPESTPNAVAVQVASVDDDAMDTTPDADTGVVLPNGSADPLETSNNAPTSPAPNGDTQVEPENSEQAPPVPSADDIVYLLQPSYADQVTNYTQTQAETAPPVDPDLPVDPNIQPPPPPPPAEPVRTDSDTLDEDDGVQPWQPIHEDTSSPDEAELKEIDEANEHSAHDHEHWEGKAFPFIRGTRVHRWGVWSD